METLRVLITDDELGMRLGVARTLRDFKVRVPDVVVLDLMMDNMDTGFTLCYHIRKKHPSLPVIMVSSVNHETGLEFDATTDRERSWIKADAFLSKPIRFEQLKTQIDRLLPS